MRAPLRLAEDFGGQVFRIRQRQAGLLRGERFDDDFRARVGVIDGMENVLLAHLTIVAIDAGLQQYARALRVQPMKAILQTIEDDRFVQVRPLACVPDPDRHGDRTFEALASGGRNLAQSVAFVGERFFRLYDGGARVFLTAVQEDDAAAVRLAARLAADGEGNHHADPSAWIAARSSWASASGGVHSDGLPARSHASFAFTICAYSSDSPRRQRPMILCHQSSGSSGPAPCRMRAILSRLARAMRLLASDMMRLTPAL